jgi:hypothetical protein
VLNQRKEESAKSEPKKAPARKASPQEIAHIISGAAAGETKAGFGEERAPDPAGHTFESPIHTGMSTQGAVEGAAQQIYSAQINSVRNAELQRALDALDDLQPQIKAFQAQGRDVHVTVVTEVPIDSDFFGDVTGVPAPNQIVYFTKMSITSAPYAPNYRAPVKPAANTSMSAVSEGESKVMDSLPDRGEHYEDPAWVNAMQMQYEITGSAKQYRPPRAGFRYEARTTVFPARGN